MFIYDHKLQTHFSHGEKLDRDPSAELRLS